MHRPASAKLFSLQTLLPLLAQHRSEGRTIVTTNGSYDVFHVGHLRSLEESRQQGDVLVVGVNSDASVKAYKSPDRPIVPQQFRAELIAGLECVDYVFVFDELDPRAFLAQIQPDVHTNGADYGEDCIERDAVLAGGGRLHLLGKFHGYSTSILIDKILKVYGERPR